LTIRLRDAIEALVGRAFQVGDLLPQKFLKDLQHRSLDIPDVAEAFGFEVRLSDGCGVDLGVALSAAGEGRRVLARAAQDPGSSAPLLGSQPWRRVAEFAARWVTPESVEIDAISHVFLEFDTTEGMSALESPSIFAGISLSSQVETGRKGAVNGVSSTESVAVRIVANLLGTAIDRDVRATLSRCTTNLPLGSLILHVGVMSARTDDVRLHVCVPEHVAAEYLRECGGCEAAAEVDELLKRYGGGAPLATIQLEIGASVGSAIGLEFSPPSALDGEGAVKWKTLLDRLMDDGLCNPGRRAELKAWPAVFEVPPRTGRALSKICRDLSHVKLIVRPNQPLRAKAYLSAVAT
jgi:hypothetical protein